jgi:hypothetical protein
MQITVREARMSGYERTPGACHIAAAPVADVMFDQLEYLTAHAAQVCPPGCADCARYRQVKGLLLLPFLSKKRQATPSHRTGMAAAG